MTSSLARIVPIALLSPLAFLACGDKDDDTGATDSGDAAGLPDNAGDAVQTYAEIVDASYRDSVAAAQDLDAAVDAFIAAPSQASLDAARQAWLDSREPYLQTEVYRFYDGPIDHPDTGPEGQINAWPLDENYIDYTVDEPTSGIVNDTGVTIDADTLAGLNEAGGEANIATGYHAIEFLLWGQDLSETGPGDRPWQDYLTDGDATAENGDRRALYLATVSDLLVADLQGVAAEWAASSSDSGGGNYREDFASDDFTAIQSALTGMIVLSGFETGGERLQAALDSGSQEDEHSCFSDNTHRDMIQDVQGVANVWHGTYTRTDGSAVTGTGLRDVVAAVDGDLAGQLDDRIAESLALANALETPFDSEIDPANTDGNARVAALIDSLRAQEDLLFEVFTLLGMSVEIPE